MVEKLNQRGEQRQLAETRKQQQEQFLAKQLIERSRQEMQTKPVETVKSMKLLELLEIANNISFEGVSVKTMYERGRLDASALRRVIKEFLQSGHYERELRHSLKAEASPNSPEFLRELSPEVEHSPELVQNSAKPHQNMQKLEQVIQDRYDIQSTPEIGVFGGQQDNSSTYPSRGRKVVAASAAVIVVVVLATALALLLLGAF